MKQSDFIGHACEQVMRFSRISQWDDLPGAIKTQLSFNMGVVALGLNLSKQDGFLVLKNLREGNISVTGFREHIQKIIEKNAVRIDTQNIIKPF